MHHLIVKAYPTMLDEHRMQILTQNFLTSINVPDLEKSVMNDTLAKASYQEIVDSVAKAEEFRKTKEKCRDKTGDVWLINQIQMEENKTRRDYQPKQDSRGYNRERQGYRPRNPYTEDREYHYCKETGHLQYNRTHRMEDHENDIERPTSKSPREMRRRFAQIPEK